MSTIDFQPVSEDSPLRYRVVCSDHGELTTDALSFAASDAATRHDGREHHGEADWLYRGASILDDWGEPSSTASPAVEVVEQARASRKAARRDATEPMF